MSYITFTEIRYMNILSTGNSFTTIKLNETQTTLIVGENGAGKSTILDALAFVLYGKPFRKINKNQLINSINGKALLVEVDFLIGKNSYTIRRGIKPNIFEIIQNGELVDQSASAKDYQEYLEMNILKLNFKSFSQIVVLGSSTFVPFMQLTPANRREIIEDILDIQIFSKMSVLQKDHLSKIKGEMTESKHKIDILSERIKTTEQHNKTISNMKKSNVAGIDAKINELKLSISEADEAIKSLNSKIEAKKETIADINAVNKASTEISQMAFKLNDKLKRLKKENDYYESNDYCSSCLQPITEEHKANHINSNNETIDEVNKGLDILSKKKEKVDARLSEIHSVEQEIQALKNELMNHTSSSSIYKRNIETLNRELREAEKEVEEVDHGYLISLDAERSKLVAEGNILKDRYDVIVLSGMLLKDGGIKTQIIKQYVPIINKLINKYLADMEFFVQFELDEQFNESIKSRFRDEFSYESFSEGEKTRIDLSLMFTWRAVSKMRSSISTNLLLMDEIFDGPLNNEGIESFMKILNEVIGNSNVFIISHKINELNDKFDNVITFEKVKDFSRIAA